MSDRTISLGRAHNAGVCQASANRLQAPSIGAKVGITQPGGRAHGDDAALGARHELDIVNKLQDSRPRLCLQIPTGIFDDRESRFLLQTIHERRPSRHQFANDLQR